MKKLIVIDETFFFHPKLIDKLCQTYNGQIIGVFLVTKTPKKNSLVNFLFNNVFKLKFSEISILGSMYLIYLFKDFLFKSFSLGKPVSVNSILRKYDIPIIKVENSLNSEYLLDFIKKNKIKIVLSSNPLYFGEKYLNLKDVVFINRHSSFLPYNGGVWPLFYSVSKKMKFVGVTIHLISKKIDCGDIVQQQKINISSNNLYDLYEECFDLSYILIKKSFEKIESNFDNYLKYNRYLANKVNYNSFPKKNDWKEFRKNSGRFVNLRNLIKLVFE